MKGNERRASRIGSDARMATQRLENVDFGGFLNEDCGLRSVAIAYNPTSRDWSPLLVPRSVKEIV